MQDVKIPGKELAKNMGRLNCIFPGSDELKLRIEIPNSNGNGFTSVYLDTVKYFYAVQGNYIVYLNNQRLELSIEKGKETSIRFGYVSIIDEDVDIKQSLETPGSIYVPKNKTIALPVGFYLCKRIPNDSRVYWFKIDENKLLVYDPKVTSDSY